MPALVLVVDDVPANVKLLEVKLSNEYYGVLTARDGYEAISQAKQHKPDLILLDVMMPGMDGFETCTKLKEDTDTAYIPIVMVTALSDIADRVRGLEAGADDFLTKPINDIALFSRVKSLVRIKVLLDELRMRDQTGVQMGVINETHNSFVSDVTNSRILIVDDDTVQLKLLTERLSQEYQIDGVSKPEGAENVAISGNFDLIVLSTQLSNVDALRLVSHFKSHEETRNVPILALVDENDSRTTTKGLELGINDYVIMPIDYNELAARVRTQIRRKKYQDALKANYKKTISQAITDGLTGLYNRHYLDNHLNNLVREALNNNKPLSLMILDIDKFKSVNDTYGHDVGDVALKHISAIIVSTVRSSDLAARLGGEEFVVLMPGTDSVQAKAAAERLRKNVEISSFAIPHPPGKISITVSIGVSFMNEMGDSGQALLKRADEAMYKAKNAGRNQVVSKE
jgi:two-component system, cell cycle response regulator